MIAEITAGLSGTKALMDIAKGLNAVSTQAQINDVRIALQEKILEVQQALAAANVAQSATAERIRELEQELVKLKDWEGEKQRYELKAVDPGSFAYMPKPGMENGEPAHWLCTQCYKRGEPSFLQFQGRKAELNVAGPVIDMYKCGTCGATMGVHFHVAPRYLREKNAEA